MIVLAIDTATPAVTAGLVRRTGSRLETLAERVSFDARGHAERLTPNVVDALAEAGLTFADVEAVVVGCGPGPFTGLRVGMATAAAYGHALDIPVYGVCSLDAIGGRTSGEVLVVTDARRREVYWARYLDGTRVAGPAVDAPGDVAAGPARAVAGSPEHTSLFDLPRVDEVYPTPAGLVGAVGDWDAEPPALVPLYLRRPDAKPVGEREPVGEPALVGEREPVGERKWGGERAITIEKLTRADVARCVELEAQLFDGDDPWPASAFLSEMSSRHNHYVAARAGDKLVGYAGIARLGLFPPHEYEVHTIGVDPAYQGQGVGRRLLAALLDFAGRGVIYLEVRTDNAAAIALYRSAGFVQVGVRRRYYRVSGADAYTMRRDPQ
jgi:tRNA threonylcarbamoyladenosine biosynthesis protein TsaB